LRRLRVGPAPALARALRARLVKVLEFGAEGVGVGVVQVVEDGQGLLPCLTGCFGRAGRVVGVAEVGEGHGFPIPAAEVAVQVDGVVVAGNGLGVVAEVLMGVAEAVPGTGLPVAVAEIDEEGEGLLAVGEGLLVVAEQGVAPANRVEGAGLPTTVAGGQVQVESLPGVVEGVGMVALPVPHLGEKVVSVGLTGRVAGLVRPVVP
jgi:hypothetical protein